MPRRVIKIGGSLLGHESLVVSLRAWLADQPAAHNVLVVGGGGLTDTVRRWDETFQLPSSETHWLCIRLLDVSARAVACLLPEATFVGQLETLRHALLAGREELWILSPEEFLRDWEPSLAPPRLPADWSVTSDSIAARLARAIAADELVLLKSALPPRPFTTTHAARIGYVDEFFPVAAKTLGRVRCVDLRRGGECWLADGSERADG